MSQPLPTVGAGATGGAERLRGLSASAARFAELLAKVGSGEHTSTGLSREEACESLDLMLAGEATEAQIGAFLIAHRIRRPQPIELTGMLDSYRQHGPSLSTPGRKPLCFGVPYDGRTRTAPMLPLLALLLSACSAAAAGLNSFQSPDGRYAFLYPTGWTRVQVSDGPQVVFHDLINADETLSLVISEVNATNSLDDLGSAVAVGEKLRRVVIAPEGSGREAELVEAVEREDGGRTFYDLEYAVHLNDRDRHELATVVVDRGRLYTLAASTNELRWPKVKTLFHQVVSSFTFQI